MATQRTLAPSLGQSRSCFWRWNLSLLKDLIVVKVLQRGRTNGGVTSSHINESFPCPKSLEFLSRVDTQTVDGVVHGQRLSAHRILSYLEDSVFGSTWVAMGTGICLHPPQTYSTGSNPRESSIDTLLGCLQTLQMSMEKSWGNWNDSSGNVNGWNLVD